MEKIPQYRELQRRTHRRHTLSPGAQSKTKPRSCMGSPAAPPQLSRFVKRQFTLL